MLPIFVYAVFAAAAVAAALVLSPTARGRRLLFRSLPAAAFFALLLLCAEIAYRVGQSEAGGAPAGASSTIYTCSMHPQVRQDHPGDCPICHMELVPLAAAASEQGTGITIDPTVVQNMGVRLGAVTQGPLQRTVRAFAAVRAAEPRLVDVTLRFDGFVERLWADTEGMTVHRGDRLFAIYAPELIVAQEELLAARRSGDAELLAAAQQKLRLWGVDDAELDRLQQREVADRTVEFRSPADGVLLARNVVQGSPAAASMPLLRIADLAEVWIDAQVPETDLAAVAVGASASVTYDAAPGRRDRGEVVFVAPQVDARARTGVVRAAVANADGALRPGMFARLEVTLRLADEALQVPIEAVLGTGLRQLVWVAVGLGRFEPRPVRLGARGDGGTVAVLEGLARGDRIVLSGQFLIDSESRLRESARKFEADGLMPGGDLPLRAAVTLSPATQRRIDALLDAYLDLQVTLAADRFEAAAWQALRRAATDATTAAEAALQLPAAELASAIGDTAPADIVAARVAFKTVSAAAANLFELARPRHPGTAELFVQHCPMAEADWLQTDAAVRNPYYGSSMLECGAVRRRLPLDAEGGK